MAAKDRTALAQSCLKIDAGFSEFIRCFATGLPDQEEAAWICYESGSWLGGEQYLQHAAWVFEKGGQLFLKLQNFGYAFICFTNSGLYLHNFGSFRKAVSAYRRAETLLSKYDAHWPYPKNNLEILMRLNQCDTLVELRKSELAIRNYQYIRTLAIAVDDTESLVRCYVGEGNIHRNQGNFPASFAAYKSAFRMAEEKSLIRSMARAQHGLFNVLLEFNQIEQGIETGKYALQLYEQANDKQGVTEMLLLIGHAHHSLVNTNLSKQYRDEDLLQLAGSYYSKAWKAAFPEDPVNAADAQIKLASLAKDIGKLDEAGKLYSELRQNPLMETDYFTAFQVWNGLGDLYLEENNLVDAIQAYQSGLRLSKHAGDQEGVSKWYALLGNALSAADKPEHSIKALKRSIQIQEKLGKTIEEDTHSIGYYSLRADVYQSLIGLLLRKKDWESAFDYLERSKAKAMREHLSQTNLQKIELNVLRIAEIKPYLMDD